MLVVQRNSTRGCRDNAGRILFFPPFSISSYFGDIYWYLYMEKKKFVIKLSILINFIEWWWILRIVMERWKFLYDISRMKNYLVILLRDIKGMGNKLKRKWKSFVFSFNVLVFVKRNLTGGILRKLKGWVKSW